MTRRNSVAQKSLVEIYKREIKNCKPISREEEQQLGLLILNGNVVAKNKLIQANLYFAWQQAKRYDYGNLPFEDLLEAANLGLCKAAERFDVRYENCFLSYARHWIKRELNELLCRERKGSCSLNSDGEYVQYVSFNATDEDGYETNYDKVMVRDTVDMEDLYAFNHDRDYLYDALEKLSSEEKEIVARYFGLYGKQPETMESIAESFGVTRQSINQRLNRIYKLIKNCMPAEFNMVA